MTTYILFDNDSESITALKELANKAPFKPVYSDGEGFLIGDLPACETGWTELTAREVESL